MSTEQNKALARRLYDEAWNKGNLDIIDLLLAPNHVNHEAENPLMPEEGQGPEGIKRSIVTNRTAFPDVHMTIEDQIAEGDTVVSRYAPGLRQLNGVCRCSRRFSRWSTCVPPGG